MRLIYYLGITHLGKAGKEYHHFGWKNECASEQLQKALDASAQKAIRRRKDWKAVQLYGEGIQMACMHVNAQLIHYFSKKEIETLNLLLEHPNTGNELSHLEPYLMMFKIGNKAKEDAHMILRKTGEFERKNLVLDKGYLDDVKMLLDFASKTYQMAQERYPERERSTTIQTALAEVRELQGARPA